MSGRQRAEQIMGDFLTNEATTDTLNISPADSVVVSRQELLAEHGVLLARVQQIRRVLGMPPLPTGNQERKASRSQGPTLR